MKQETLSQYHRRKLQSLNDQLNIDLSMKLARMTTEQRGRLVEMNFIVNTPYDQSIASIVNFHVKEYSITVEDEFEQSYPVSELVINDKIYLLEMIETVLKPYGNGNNKRNNQQI